MRILVLGAGGTGGYFGGRLAQAGVDVTFLVRPARAAQLQRDGLVIRSPLGDARIAARFTTADALPAVVSQQPFDLVMLSCKAYDLDSSIEAIAPAMGPGTTLLPILNGLAHYAPLDSRFGRAALLDGEFALGRLELGNELATARDDEDPDPLAVVGSLPRRHALERECVPGDFGALSRLQRQDLLGPPCGRGDNADHDDAETRMRERRSIGRAR